MYKFWNINFAGKMYLKLLEFQDLSQIDTIMLLMVSYGPSKAIFVAVGSPMKMCSYYVGHTRNWYID